MHTPEISRLRRLTLKLSAAAMTLLVASPPTIAAESAPWPTKAVTLMVAQPSMIKRPIVEHPGGLLIGFKADEWAAALG